MTDKEKKYTDWMESIIFVDRFGNNLPLVLDDDDSEDPENDRSEK